VNRCSRAQLLTAGAWEGGGGWHGSHRGKNGRRRHRMKMVAESSDNDDLSSSGCDVWQG
jgi:hypothetical protein